MKPIIPTEDKNKINPLMPEEQKDSKIPWALCNIDENSKVFPNQVSISYTHPSSMVISQHKQIDDINLVGQESESRLDKSVHLENLSFEKIQTPMAIDLFQTGVNSKDNFRKYDGCQSNDLIEFQNKSIKARCKKCKKDVKTKSIHTLLLWPTQCYCWV